MIPEEKAKELVMKFVCVPDNAIKEGSNAAWIDKILAKQCALIAVQRNIDWFNDFISRMDDFSNESRQVIYQLIEDEEKIKTEIKKL